MIRGRDMDAIAEAIEQAQGGRRSWQARLVRWAVVKAGPFLTAAVVVTAMLHVAHVDLGWLQRAMFYGSPFIAATVVSFVVVAWRQNTGLTYTPQASQVGQVGQAEPGQVSQPLPGQVTKPAQPATITVTVLPAPVAALPQAVGQTDPTRYPAEEETP